MEHPQTIRNPYFDNLKFVLIYLVVAGHFLLPLNKQPLFSNLFFLIYTFHMPCFVLVSGYFSKKVVVNGHFRTEKLGKVLWLYLIYKLLAYGTEGLAAGGVWEPIDFFTESGAPWYLLSLACWYLTLPVVAELNPKMVLLGSILISLLSGYQSSVGYFLSLTRTISFAPFFYIGYYLNEHHIDYFRKLYQKMRFLIMFLLIAILIFFGSDSFLSPYTRIVYGTGYRYLGDYAIWGPIVRTAWYGTAAVLSTGLMAFIPTRSNCLTAVGSRTMQIYVLHRLIRDIFQAGGFYNLAGQIPALLLLSGILAGSLFLTLLLGTKNLTVLFDWIQKLPFQHHNRHAS